MSSTEILLVVIYPEGFSNKPATVGKKNEQVNFINAKTLSLNLCSIRLTMSNALPPALTHALNAIHTKEPKRSPAGSDQRPI